jgi:hypothetical protein
MEKRIIAADVCVKLRRIFDAVVGVFPPTTLAEAPLGIIYKHHKNTYLYLSKKVVDLYFNDLFYYCGYS